MDKCFSIEYSSIHSMNLFTDFNYRVIKSLTLVWLLLNMSSCNPNEKSEGCLIEVNVNDAVKSIYLEEIANDIKFLKLESKKDLLIAEVSKLAIGDSSIFIFDRKQASLFAFHINGQFKYVIKNPSSTDGRKFEYIRDIYYDSDLNHLFVVDANANVIYEFDNTGLLVNDIEPVIRPASIFRLTSSSWVVMNAWAGTPEYPEKLYVLNDDFSEILGSGISNSKSGNITSPNPFTKHEDRVRFIHGLDNAVYEIHLDTISQIGKVDFGSYYYDEALSEKPRMQMMMEFLEGDYAGLISNYFEFSDFITLNYTRAGLPRSEGAGRFVIFDKNQNAVVQHGRNLVIKKGDISIRFPLFRLGNSLGSYMDFYDLNKEDVFKANGNGVNSDYGWYSDLETLKQVTGQYDSPILVFYNVVN